MRPWLVVATQVVGIPLATVCGVDQVVGVNVSDAPVVTVRFVDPLARAVVTVTLDVGADVSDTW